jgi:hypothetical protein
VAKPHTFLAKINGFDDRRTGEQVELVCAMEKAHFFDNNTEETIV